MKKDRDMERQTYKGTERQKHKEIERQTDKIIVSCLNQRKMALTM